MQVDVCEQARHAGKPESDHRAVEPAREGLPGAAEGICGAHPCDPFDFIDIG